MIYKTESAAKKVGLSKRQFLRLVKTTGKTVTAMGSKRILLFSEAELLHIESMKRGRMGRPKQ